jgi:hypothetical protein
MTATELASLRVAVSTACGIPLTADAVDLIDTLACWAEALLSGRGTMAMRFTGGILEQWGEEADPRLVLTVVRETLSLRGVQMYPDRREFPRGTREAA